MTELIEILRQPWPWYVAGPMIALVMLSLLFFGNSFGISSNLRTICSVLGGGKNCEYFDFDWKSQLWNLVFAAGLIIGGVISSYHLSDGGQIELSNETASELREMGIQYPGAGFVPAEIFSWESLLTLKGFVMLVIGGFLVGFGTRYAGGCTSGHAISGLSDLQPASLLAVIGFFIGGLLVTYFVLPGLLST
ncbi:MAG: YeeE/YedE thiosulfate transporter family protein [Bacteroidota bacterium]